MSMCVCTGAVLKCSFGSFPSEFNAMPTARVLACGREAGVITDLLPEGNIASFGLCKSPTNPAVAAATAAAMGELTPMPCLPVPAGSWLQTDSKVLVGGRPVLTNGSKLMCIWGGEITVQFAGQTSVML